MVEQKYCDKCKRKGDFDVCAECHRGSKYEKKPISWGAKIRSMSDEELADFLEEFEVCTHCKYVDGIRCTFENPCTHGFASAMAYEWLKSEVKE